VLSGNGQFRDASGVVEGSRLLILLVPRREAQARSEDRGHPQRLPPAVPAVIRAARGHGTTGTPMRRQAP